MAPNLKRITLLSSHLADLKLVHPKVAATSSADVLAAPAIDSDSYWEWKSEDLTQPLDLFSVSHIAQNLVKDASLSEVSETNPDFDSYWAEAADHAEVEDQPSSYWSEAQHEATESDSYWNPSPRETSAPTKATCAQDTLTDSDQYWGDRGSDSLRYWTWKADVKTASDLYWQGI
jgi:hypothetical protein